jgi:hypothetical protein
LYSYTRKPNAITISNCNILVKYNKIRLTQCFEVSNKIKTHGYIVQKTITTAPHKLHGTVGEDMANGGVNRDVETIVSPGFPAL